jgi:hypothetical protein
MRLPVALVDEQEGCRLPSWSWETPGMPPWPRAWCKAEVGVGPWEGRGEGGPKPLFKVCQRHGNIVPRG